MTPSSSSSGRPRGFVRGPRVADHMTHELQSFVTSSLAAERAGDAATALEYHSGVPMFRRSAHRVLLTQLVDLAEEMTPWLWARWAAYQCTRNEDPGTVGGELTRLALDYTVAMFYEPEMAAAWDAGDDPVPFIASVGGECWAFHQLCTYEFGGLEVFLARTATGRLADETGLADSWVDARMGGYRLEIASDSRLLVRDLADDRPIELFDLGAGVHADEGAWLIGRLVPSGGGALMFDSRPLVVDEQVARETAIGEERGAWVSALASAIRDGRFDKDLLRSPDRELVTDVPGLSLLAAGTPDRALASALDALREGRDEIGRAAYRVLRAAADGELEGPLAAAYVAAAVANPHGFAEARRQLVRPGQSDAWARWAERVAEPARGRLELLAELSGPMAA